MHDVQYLLHNAKFTMHYRKCTIYNAQCTIHNARFNSKLPQIKKICRGSVQRLYLFCYLQISLQKINVWRHMKRTEGREEVEVGCYIFLKYLLYQDLSLMYKLLQQHYQNHPATHIVRQYID